MNADEKLKRLLQDDWEIHGDPQQLCLIAREEILRRRLTEDERKAMDHAIAFWNAYVALPPSLADPLCRDVHTAVNAIQRSIAVRVAGRCEPEYWRHYEGT